jgi:glycine/D-amino acid oxidase-like deaminating enzyme
MAIVEATVLGSGVIGLTTAYVLQRNGYDVTIVHTGDIQAENQFYTSSKAGGTFNLMKHTGEALLDRMMSNNKC